MTWPRDVDGDVFRRMRDDGFDFTRVHEIEFTAEFDRWPPPSEAVSILRSMFAGAQAVDAEVDSSTGERFGGYFAFKIRAIVTYELVMKTQAEVTRAMSPFGGRCESWGVAQLDD